MKFGLFLAPFGDLADPRTVAEVARRTEEWGWQGLYLWDHVLGPPGVAIGDVWTALSAAACRTMEVRLGPMVTPLPRRRPRVLARQIISLDHLSDGRLTVGVGLGSDGWKELSSFGDETDTRTRAAQFDEGLVVLKSLLSGRTVQHDGPHFCVEADPFLPRTLQQPVPI